MSWESSLEYYRLVNQITKERLGGFHSAKSVMYSVDFAEVEELQHTERWDRAARLLAAAAGGVERAGADFLVLCTNTMHRVADEIAAVISIPLLHIADATAEAVRREGISTVGLLGTRFTMEQDFYVRRLHVRYGLEVLTPHGTDRTLVHDVIYDELVHGQVRAESKAAYGQIIARLVDAGAQGIILGCTEIGMLIKEDDAPVPLFDTTRLHAEAAVEEALR
jgi:aspartate racemase